MLHRLARRDGEPDALLREKRAAATVGVLGMRINVTGNAASGKTTLAQRLGAELQLPVFSLDSIVWQTGWRKTPTEERREAEQKLTALPSWVIDGVSAHVRDRADVVVFLDTPASVCALRGVVRAFRYFSKTRPGLPEGCPDIVIVPHLKLIYGFASKAGAQIREDAAWQPSRFRVERYPLQVEALMRRLKAPHDDRVAR
jgi:adenylate kinase family enzyme